MFSKFANRYVDNTKGKFLTLKDYEEKVKKLEQENLNLKIRIHFMEGNQGLDKSPDGKENVYKINIDLQVEKENLLAEINDLKNNHIEKDYLKKELMEAYKAIDEYESEIKALKSDSHSFRTADSSIGTKSNDDAGPKEHFVNQHSQEIVLENAGRPSLSQYALEAFESLNLGAPSTNDANKEMKEKIQSLETELNIERDHSRDLKRMCEDKEKKIIDVSKDLSKKEMQIISLDEEANAELDSKDEKLRVFGNQLEQYREQVTILEENLNGKNEEINTMLIQISDLNKKIEDIEHQNSALKSQFELDQKASEDLSSRRDHEVHEMIQALNSAQKALEEEVAHGKEQQTYLNVKLTEISQLRKTMADLESQLITKDDQFQKTEENLTKMELAVEGLTKITTEQNEAKISMEKELKQKSFTLDRMIKEYEIAKAKVRQYRAERANTNNSLDSQEGMEQCSIDNFKPINKYQKNQLIKHGAEKALNKAQNLYNEQLQKFEFHHQSIMSMMRTRLVELARFIETLLSHGVLDMSALDESFRDILQKSLDESRMSVANLDETLADDPAMAMPLPRIQIDLDDVDLQMDSETAPDITRIIEDHKKIHEEEKNNLMIELDQIRLELATKEILEKEKSELELHLGDLKNKFEATVTDKNAKIEDLRVKYGNFKEKNSLLQEDNDKLRDKTKALKELSKLQTENENMKKRFLLEEKAVETAVKEYKIANKQLNDEKARDESELEMLRANLSQATDKLKKFQERQDELQKGLRHQLAKTHR